MDGNWFFSADWHLGHSNIVKYCKRPFMSREEEGLLAMVDKKIIPTEEVLISSATTTLMTDTIIDNTNAVVGENDHFVLIGDFCWTPKNDRHRLAKYYRDRIKCKNVYLIFGNHDDRQVLSPLFKACYDHYVFNIDGQKIFTDHYPSRSWDGAYYASWMLYGHVHNLFNSEDNGELMPYEKSVYSEGFESVLSRYGVESRDPIISDLLAVCASLKGIDLTLDVGVDNLIRGAHIPWGTPWSMSEIRHYMNGKKVRWNLRQENLKNLKSLSTSHSPVRTRNLEV